MEALFKQYFWIVKGLGLAITAALAASVVTTYVGTSYIYGEGEADTEAGDETGDTEGDDDDDEDKPPVSNPFASSTSQTSRPSSGDRSKMIQNLVAYNVFCPTCVKVEEAPLPGGEGAAPGVQPGEIGGVYQGVQPGEVASTLPLRLVATMESSDPKFSWATIRDEETGGAGPFWPGDNLAPSAILVSVERRMVHLRHSGRLEYIELGVEPPKGQPKPAQDAATKKIDDEPPPSGRGIPGASDAIKCESEHSCTIDRAWLEGVLSNPAVLAKQARVMPSVKDGETRGFKFYGIRPDSLPKLLNIKNGDLITSVNGTELKSMDGAMSLYAKLRRASNLSISIERKGETITKEITIQ